MASSVNPLAKMRSLCRTKSWYPAISASLGAEAADLALHARGVAGIVEVGAVREEDAVERVDGHQGQVILALPARQLEEVIDQPRRGDDGWAAIEREAVLPVDVGAATRLVPLLEQRHLVPARGQPHSGGQAAKPRANHDDPLCAAQACFPINRCVHALQAMEWFNRRLHAGYATQPGRRAVSGLRSGLLVVLAVAQATAGLRVALRLLRTAHGTRIQRSSHSRSWRDE